MTTAVLLGFAAILATLTPKLAGAAWAARAPRLAIHAWQAATVGLVATSVLAGLTLLVPATAIGGGLAQILDACATTIASVYGAPERLPAVLLGTLLAAVLPAHLAVVAARTVHGSVVTGAFRIVLAWRSGSWLLGLWGALGIVVGLWLAAAPGPGLLTLICVVAIQAVIGGALLVGLAFRLRRVHHDPTPG